MLIQKYKAKRDFKNKHITIPIYSSINNLESSDRFNDFIQEETNKNINKIVDYDTSIFTNNHSILLILSDLIPEEDRLPDWGYTEEDRLPDWGYTEEDVISSTGRKSFILLEFYDNYKISNRSLLFREYINGINYNLEYQFNSGDLSFNIPNNITSNLYLKCSFFNAKTGKFTQLSPTPTSNINKESDIFMSVEFLTNKKYNIKYNNINIDKLTLNKINNDKYNDKLNETATISEFKKPNYPDGTQLIYDDNEIKFKD